VAKLDSAGNFSFIHLPPGVYYIYALVDQGGYRYQNNEQLFAFADSAVVLPGAKPITLYASATPAKVKPSSVKAKPSKDKRLKFTTSLSDNKQDLLSKFSFSFETPLRDFDSSKVHFVTDTTFTPVTGAYQWSMDSTKKKVTLNYAWKENTPYHFILEKNFAIDTLGQQLLKLDTVSFSTKTREDYGKLVVRLRNLDLTHNPVLLFVQNGQVVYSFPLSAAIFSQALFVPGEYNLRIVNDRNKNGVWDPGEFFGKHLQPESVKPIQRKIIVKANLDNDFEIDVNAVAAPTTRPPVGVQGGPRSLLNPVNQR